MKKLIIFDMDGLLLDTERLYQKYWLQVIQDKGLPLTHDDMKQTVGMGLEQMKNFLLKYVATEEDFVELRNKREILFWADIEKNGLPLKSGALEVLDYLIKKKVKTALITSTEENRADKLLKLAGIEHNFDYRIFGNMVKKTKPDPEVYQYLARLTDIDKQDWIVFEDSYNGIKAANNAGVDVIWVRDLIDLSESDANYVAACLSLNEVYPYFK